MKKWLYVGGYTDINDNFILKIGSTNNLERRKKEHMKNYQKSKKHQMVGEFSYYWAIPLSKYSVERYEESIKENFKNLSFGKYVPKDRFAFKKKPKKIIIKIKKNYTISLD